MAKANRVALSESHLLQINVLKAMSALGVISPEPRPYELTELARMTGIHDEREIQRYLYILEGQKLVTPYPEGDFTSRTWVITSSGLDAVRNLERLGLHA